MTAHGRRCSVALAFATVLGANCVTAMDDDLLPHVTHPFVSYLTGGVGADEQDAIRKAAPTYPLELLFLERGDIESLARQVYTAGVDVTIRNSVGRVVLEATAAGPFMLASLPDGEYTISANDDGRSMTRRVRVDQTKHQRIVFEWNSYPTTNSIFRGF